MTSRPTSQADFYTGVVAEMYHALRSERNDPELYVEFIRQWGEPALELGCGDGDPILDLRDLGLDVEGLDSSPDMLDRAREAARSRGIDVTLHHTTIEAMALGRRYRSVFLAGATFNLLADDATADLALRRIAGHLEPDGAAMIPLFVPQVPEATDVGRVREARLDDGRLARLRVGGIDRDGQARTQTTSLHYEIVDGPMTETFERRWVLHWFEETRFAAMVEQAGMSVIEVRHDAADASTTHSTAFTFVVGHPATGSPILSGQSPSGRR